MQSRAKHTRRRVPDLVSCNLMRSSRGCLSCLSRLSVTLYSGHTHTQTHMHEHADTCITYKNTSTNASTYVIVHVLALHPIRPTPTHSCRMTPLVCVHSSSSRGGSSWVISSLISSSVVTERLPSFFETAGARGSRN